MKMQFVSFFAVAATATGMDMVFTQDALITPSEALKLNIGIGPIGIGRSIKTFGAKALGGIQNSLQAAEKARAIRLLNKKVVKILRYKIDTQRASQYNDQELLRSLQEKAREITIALNEHGEYSYRDYSLATWDKIAVGDFSPIQTTNLPENEVSLNYNIGQILLWEIENAKNLRQTVDEKIRILKLNASPSIHQPTKRANRDQANNSSPNVITGHGWNGVIIPPVEQGLLPGYGGYH